MRKCQQNKRGYCAVDRDCRAFVFVELFHFVRNAAAQLVIAREAKVI